MESPTNDNLRSSANNLRQSAANGGGEGQPISDPLCRSVAKSRRGGRRPGAGASKGNLNALKHGRRSRQFAELGRIVASVPEAKNTLLAFDRRNNAKSRRAEEAAAERMVAFYQHCKDIAEGKPSPGPFQALAELNAGLNARRKALNAAQSKKERDVLNSALEEIDRELEKMQKSQTNNQPVPRQSDPKYEIAPD